MSILASAWRYGLDLLAQCAYLGIGSAVLFCVCSLIAQTARRQEDDNA